MRILIENALVVNEGQTSEAAIAIGGEYIEGIYSCGTRPGASFDMTIDAAGCYVLPGVIDDHVHFREPGLTDKADMESESRAAAAGGVTTIFDMPNTVPQTTTLQALDDKFALAARECHVNHSFFFGATNANVALFDRLDAHRIPGIKLFMGSSTGNMLVDKRDALERIFGSAGMPVMVHCEDTSIINRSMQAARAAYGDDPDVALHPSIRSAEACFESTRLAVELARKHGTQLHVAHLSTERELSLFGTDPNITAEAVVGHLYFSEDDYAKYGSLIKVNPAIKSAADRDALRRALTDGRITVVGTDHAPHLLSQKQGGCMRAASGMPMVQFSLPTMLELVDSGVLTIERLVELMCHNPATLFGVRERGFVRPGYKADLVVVRPGSPWTVTDDIIESKCGWSPMAGHEYQWRVECTLCNGHPVYSHSRVDTGYVGQAVAFR